MAAQQPIHHNKPRVNRKIARRGRTDDLSRNDQITGSEVSALFREASALVARDVRLFELSEVGKRVLQLHSRSEIRKFSNSHAVPRFALIFKNHHVRVVARVAQELSHRLGILGCGQGSHLNGPLPR